MVDRVVLVTGGLGAIGMAVARAFASEGAALVLLDHRADGDEQVCRALEQAGAAQAISLAVDIADDAGVAAAVGHVFATFGRLDVIVNVAGVMIYREIASLTGADWRRVLDVNLIGAALLIGQGLARMSAGGCIINVASVHARRTTSLVAPYAAAKAALVSLTRSAAIEGKPLGIRVNAVLPGAIDTPMLRDSPAIRSGAEVLAEADIGQPGDIAHIVRFLASADARFITGEDVVADNGRMGQL